MSASPACLRHPFFAWLIVIAALAAAPHSAGAVPIDGKHGFGIEVGDLLSTRAEGALLYGKSDRTAWMLLINVSETAGSTDASLEYVTPDTLFTFSENRDGFSVSMGPGIRKFLRPAEHFSPYFDATLRGIRAVFTDNSSDSSPNSRGGRSSEWGVEGGFAIGAEYFFERWPVSLAAHANLVTARYSRRVQQRTRTGAREIREEETFTISGGLGPRLQVRVYF